MRPSRSRALVQWGSVWLLASMRFAAIASGQRRESFFGSDDLYLATLFQDLVRWSGRYSDWQLTPAPYYFPDMAIYFAVRACIHSLEWAQYVSAFVHLLLFVWGARRLVRAVAPPWAADFELVGPITLCGLALYLGDRAPLVEALLQPTNHGGGAWLSCFVLALCLAPPAAWPRRTSLLVVVGLSMLTGFSDPLFAVSCGGPLLLMAAATWLPVPELEPRARRDLGLRAALAGGSAKHREFRICATAGTRRCLAAADNQRCSCRTPRRGHRLRHHTR